MTPKEAAKLLAEACKEQRKSGFCEGCDFYSECPFEIL